MAKVKNLNPFHKATASVKRATYEIRLELKRIEACMKLKTNIINSTKKDQERPRHPFRQLVGAIEDLEFVERKFNIRYGSGTPPENKIVFVSLCFRHIIFEQLLKNNQLSNNNAE
ncbi:MAG TPA: hypothetical protein VIL78_19645 [Hanamia sp.]